MLTTTCYILQFTHAVICYQQQPVPQLQPLPPVQGYVTPGLAAMPGYQQPVTPTWQDIIRQQQNDDGSDDQ